MHSRTKVALERAQIELLVRDVLGSRSAVRSVQELTDVYRAYLCLIMVLEGVPGATRA